MDDLRVLIVAGDSLARAGLASMLADQVGYLVVGQVVEEEDLNGALEVFGPDILIWDLGWDPTAQLERLADLREASPPVVALLPDETHASQARAAGATGLLMRDADATDLLAATRAVSRGMVVLHPDMAATAVPDISRIPAPPVEPLTPREFEVLRLLAEGLPNKGIAHLLDISEHTVKFHVNSILAKLGTQSRTEAVIHATRLGLIIL